MADLKCDQEVGVGGAISSLSILKKTQTNHKLKRHVREEKVSECIWQTYVSAIHLLNPLRTLNACQTH